MSQEAIKLTEKSGTSISKDKLLEAIRKSPSKQFTYSQSQNSKLITVVLTLQVTFRGHYLDWWSSALLHLTRTKRIYFHHARVGAYQKGWLSNVHILKIHRIHTSFRHRYVRVYLMDLPNNDHTPTNYRNGICSFHYPLVFFVATFLIVGFGLKL